MNKWNEMVLLVNWFGSGICLWLSSRSHCSDILVYLYVFIFSGVLLNKQSNENEVLRVTLKLPQWSRRWRDSRGEHTTEWVHSDRICLTKVDRIATDLVQFMESLIFRNSICCINNWNMFGYFVIIMLRCWNFH